MTKPMGVAVIDEHADQPIKVMLWAVDETPAYAYLTAHDALRVGAELIMAAWRRLRNG